MLIFNFYHSVLPLFSSNYLNSTKGFDMFIKTLALADMSHTIPSKSTSSTCPMPPAIALMNFYIRQSIGRLYIHIRNRLLFKRILEGWTLPSMLSNRTRLLSKVHGLPSKTFDLSLAMENCTMKIPFSIGRTNTPLEIAQIWFKVLLRASKLYGRTDKSLPTIPNSIGFCCVSSSISSRDTTLFFFRNYF